MIYVGTRMYKKWYVFNTDVRGTDDKKGILHKSLRNCLLNIECRLPHLSWAPLETPSLKLFIPLKYEEKRNKLRQVFFHDNNKYVTIKYILLISLWRNFSAFVLYMYHCTCINVMTNTNKYDTNQYYNLYYKSTGSIGTRRFYT